MFIQVFGIGSALAVVCVGAWLIKSYTSGGGDSSKPGTSISLDGERCTYEQTGVGPTPKDTDLSDENPCGKLFNGELDTQKDNLSIDTSRGANGIASRIARSVFSVRV